MKDKYRYINTKFWDDNYIINLDPSEKLLFLYFLTNPLTNLSGIFEISIKRISSDTGYEKEMVEKILNRFSKDDKIFYLNGWIFIKNFTKNQKFLGEKLRIAIKKEFQKIPKEIKAKIREISIPYRQNAIPQKKDIKIKDIKIKDIKYKEKELTNVQIVVNKFFELKGWEKEELKKKNILYARFTRPAKELLEIAESVDKALWALDRIKNWADSQEIDWGIETCLKRWFDLEELPQERQKKTYIEGCRAYQKGDDWYVIQPNGEHKKWVGSLTAIEHK